MKKLIILKSATETPLTQALTIIFKGHSTVSDFIIADINMLVADIDLAIIEELRKAEFKVMDSPI